MILIAEIMNLRQLVYHFLQFEMTITSITSVIVSDSICAQLSELV